MEAAHASWGPNNQSLIKPLYGLGTRWALFTHTYMWNRKYWGQGPGLQHPDKVCHRVTPSQHSPISVSGSKQTWQPITFSHGFSCLSAPLTLDSEASRDADSESAWIPRGHQAQATLLTCLWRRFIDPWVNYLLKGKYFQPMGGSSLHSVNPEFSTWRVLTKCRLPPGDFYLIWLFWSKNVTSVYSYCCNLSRPWESPSKKPVYVE